MVMVVNEAAVLEKERADSYAALLESLEEGEQPPAETIELKDPKDYTLIGTDVGNVDIDKIRYGKTFIWVGLQGGRNGVRFGITSTSFWPSSGVL